MGADGLVGEELRLDGEAVNLVAVDVEGDEARNLHKKKII